MKVRFWGVRGSFAAPGPEFMRYGGNTTAVEFIANSGQRLLVDLGTGVTQGVDSRTQVGFDTGLDGIESEGNVEGKSHAAQIAGGWQGQFAAR